MRRISKFTLLGVIAFFVTLNLSAQTNCLKGTTTQICGKETPITTDLADQYDPSISGNIIVYTDARGSDLDVWYYDLNTRQEHPVTTAAGDQELSAVRNGLIVYNDYAHMDVMTFDTSTGTTHDLTNNVSSISTEPATDGTIVAWSDNAGGVSPMQIYGKNINTGELRLIADSPSFENRGPAVDNGIIAWYRCPAGPCDVLVYDWSTATTRQITNTPADDERDPDVSGGRVVYQAVRSGESDICEFDLHANSERCLSLTGVQSHSRISGDWVSIEDVATGLPKLKLWYLPTNEVFDVGTVLGLSATTAQFLSDIDVIPPTDTDPAKGRVVYTDNRLGQLDIYMFEFTWGPLVTKPVFDTPLPSPVVEATSLNNTVVSFAVTAHDENGAVSVSCVPASATAFKLGTTTVNCTASNNAGTTNASFNVVVKDTTPPNLNLPSNVTADAIAPNGAPVTFIASASDLVDSNPFVTCTPGSGSTFAIGTTIVSCTAKDFSGNVSPVGTFSVLVKAAAQQVLDLIQTVQSYNLAHGIENSLDSKLQNAEAALIAANAGNRSNVCGVMGAFINDVSAKSGTAIPVSDANYLIDAANRIRNVLACP